jgi:hypothetical protein
MSDKESIFVQIASYRDPQLSLTLDDLLSKAKNSENITIGICWQHSSEDTWDNIDNFKNDPRVRIIDIDYKDSKGACWARSKVQSLYSGEKYTLQIDSHMRFIQDWDDKVISMWKDLNDPKAILTSYPPEFYPDKEEELWKKEPHIIHVYSISGSETSQRPKTPKDWKNRASPYRAIHVAAGFIFASSSIIKDVPYDPDLYFSGEEANLAIRFFTNGYNLYHPHKIILWHYYTRKEFAKHWSDHKDWHKLSKTAKERLKILTSNKDKQKLDKFGIGSVRTLEDYQNYSGIDYSRNILHLDTIEAKEPPVDLSKPERWSYVVKTFKQKISWDYDSIEKCDDPSFWAFIFKDQHNNEIYRIDLKYSENKDLIDGKITEKEFTFTYHSPYQEPKAIIVWPYSKSKKWLKNIKEPIKDSI